MKGSYKDGEEYGPFEEYHDNGQLKMKGSYKDGEEDGPYEEYYENGHSWKIETYKDGELILRNITRY
jgi:antitoxin component YwqK of YwqJK toxin-antitoxin module